jgi:hypothetical protein
MTFVHPLEPNRRNRHIPHLHGIRSLPHTYYVATPWRSLREILQPPQRSTPPHPPAPQHAVPQTSNTVQARHRTSSRSKSATTTSRSNRTRPITGRSSAGPSTRDPARNVPAGVRLRKRYRTGRRPGDEPHSRRATRSDACQDDVSSTPMSGAEIGPRTVRCPAQNGRIAVCGNCWPRTP